MSQEFALHGRLQSSMILQRDVPIPIRGWGGPGQTVRVQFDGQEDAVIIDDTGRFSLDLEPREAGGPYQLVAECGSKDIVLEDIYVGDVWFCSGQSNMQFVLSASDVTEEELATADDPLLRLGTADVRFDPKPQEDVQVTWKKADADSARNFSAVAYYFARQLREKLDIPIGVLVAAMGHTPAEAWMSREALESDSAFDTLLSKWDLLIEEHPEALDDYGPFKQIYREHSKAYSPLFDAWYPAAKKAYLAGEPIPPQPEAYDGLGNPQLPMTLYNGCIAPLTSFPVRGFTWYQGETNAIFGRSYQYRKLFRALIRSWRDAWGQPDAPFLYAQIANHADVQCNNPEALWPELREAQLMALAEPNTAMAVTIDIGETDQIHPKNKRDVGKRLAQAALVKSYKQDAPHSGPIYTGFQKDGNKITICFDHVLGGLELRSHERGNGIVITGNDQKFVDAQATIQGHTLVVWHDEISDPAAVRYGWTHDPPATLFNSEGLPASPFRTDDWATVSR